MTYRDNLFKSSGANAVPTNRQSLLSQYNDEIIREIDQEEL